jgi:hypothetical protein
VPSTINYNGSDSYLLGVNYAWKNYDGDFASPSQADLDSVRADFAQFKSEGVHVLRWWLFGDGNNQGLFDDQGQVTGLTPQFFNVLDQQLKAAADNQIYLDLTLFDFAMIQPAQQTQWGIAGGHGNVLTDPAVEHSMVDNIILPLVQHIAAGPYKDTVMAYNIMNEPEWALADFTGGPDSPTLAQMRTFVDDCVKDIHQFDPGALATVGSAKPVWVNSWEGLGLDFYCVHYYPGFDNPSQPGSGLPTCASLGLDKPCVVEEFATAAYDGNGQNQMSYTLGDPTPYSAQWYLDYIYQQGYAGALGWSVTGNDGYSDWKDFTPVFQAWEQAHQDIVNPQPSLLDPAGPWILAIPEADWTRLEPAIEGAVANNTQGSMLVLETPDETVTATASFNLIDAGWASVDTSLTNVITYSNMTALFSQPFTWRSF